MNIYTISMKQDTDHLIDRFARLTHSPRGRFAANDETYRQLISRLTEAPVARTQNPTGTSIGTRTRRWSAAAGVAAVIGFGIAIAGIYVYNDGFFSDNDSAQNESIVTGTATARTLVFENQPLSDIASALSEAYGVTIRIDDPTLSAYRLTATFSTDEPLHDVLDILAEAGSFSYVADDNVIILKK